MPSRNISDPTIRWLFQLGGWGFSLLAMAWGMALLFQPDSRMSSRGWTVAMAFISAGPDFWGSWLLIAGSLMLLAMFLQHRGSALMLIASGCVSFAIFGRFVASLYALVDPAASYTGPPAWFAFTCVYMAQGLIHSRIFRKSP